MPVLLKKTEKVTKFKTSYQIIYLAAEASYTHSGRDFYWLCFSLEHCIQTELLQSQKTPESGILPKCAIYSINSLSISKYLTSSTWTITLKIFQSSMTHLSCFWNISLFSLILLIMFSTLLISRGGSFHNFLWETVQFVSELLLWDWER